MSNVVKAILVLACVSIVWAAQGNLGNVTTDQQQAIEKGILAAHEEMKKAAADLDADALYAHVLDTIKCPIIESGKVAQTRQDALESTRRGFQGIKQVSYTYKQRQITPLSPTAALWVGEGTTSVTLEDGTEVAAPFAETIIFVEKDGRWKVLHAHRSTPNPQ
jgi:ketosteroid isomerase-like protein